MRTIYDELMEKEEKWNLKFFLQNRPDLAAKLQKGAQKSNIQASSSLPTLPKMQIIGGKPVPSVLNRQISHKRHDWGRLYSDAPGWKQ
eukprot:CAMPEP_0181438332 /NCGR_PEP_ID=MMETSP1110-20121109/21854_1 /TAXON_ID=174948 /ORGANISM="Symbiodinium sp., Strain CCMP421" /LENGTH=87 /DNA_ID=CAMNT_0023562015 /DNA_START=41 /DNA_END=304 /DNA_ORIENTATION=-